MSVRPIPEGYQSVTPYLIIAGAEQAIEFYQRALNATVVMRLDGTDGKIMHAEMQIGDSKIMLSNEWPEMGYRSPLALGGTPVSLHVYVEDVDATFAQAIAAGGKEHKPVQDQFYGDRTGTFIDPFGHMWSLATHIEDVPPEEIGQRLAKMSQSQNQ